MIISIDAEKEFIKIQFPLISRIDIKGMYFNIIFEVLAREIRQEKERKYIKTEKGEVKL